MPKTRKYKNLNLQSNSLLWTVFDLMLKEYICHGNLDVLESKLRQIKTKYLCNTRISVYRIVRGGYQPKSFEENKS